MQPPVSLNLIKSSVRLSSEVEWIPTKARTIVGTLTSFFFTFGQMILAGLACWLRDWRKLQVVVCAPYFLFFAYSWSVETFKWTPIFSMIGPMVLILSAL